MFARVALGRETTSVDDMYIDVYGFSMILYEVITQRKAWESHSTGSIEARVKSGERPAIPADIIQAYANSRESVLLDLMQNCWAQNPQERPTFDAIVRMLDEIGSVSEREQLKQDVN